ncbi:hypothetical protein D3C81_1985160 [compost metagenome]
MCGNNCGILRGKAMSMPMMAVIGAVNTFCTLPAETQAASFCFASGDFTKAMRAGCEFIEVGAHFINS